MINQGMHHGVWSIGLSTLPWPTGDFWKINNGEIYFKECIMENQEKKTWNTEAEASGIIKLIRHPNHKDQANTNNNFHAAVLAFFYRKRKSENDSFFKKYEGKYF